MCTHGSLPSSVLHGRFLRVGVNQAAKIAAANGGLPNAVDAVMATAVAGGGNSSVSSNNNNNIRHKVGYSYTRVVRRPSYESAMGNFTRT